MAVPPRDGGGSDREPGAIIPLSRFSALLARPRGRRRVELILGQPDAAAAVAAMDVQDLYLLVREVGLADARELVALATPEQLQGFLDLDGWTRDHLDEAQLRPWLEALAGAGPERLTGAWRELDPELTGLLLARWTRIYNLAEEEVPEDEEPPFYPTPDRFFLVKITAPDEDTVRLVERLLDHLYRADPELARHSLRVAASEPEAYLEETSYRFRTGRLADLGYVPREEALEIYQPLEVAAVQPGEATADRPAAPASLPVAVAEGALRGPFLSRVLAHVVAPDEARRLEAALVALVNRALAADLVPPGELARAAEVAERAMATLSLGLEAVLRLGARREPTYTEEDLARGREALGTVSLARLHRVGHTVALQASRLAAALGPRAQLADEPYRRILAAVTGPRPAFPVELDPAGAAATPPSPGRTRPLRTLHDVERVVEKLAEVALQLRFVYEHLRVDPEALGPGVTLGDVGRTAVVNALLSRPKTQRIREKDLLELRRTSPSLPEDAFPREYLRLVLGWRGQLEEAGGLLRE